MNPPSRSRYYRKARGEAPKTAGRVDLAVWFAGLPDRPPLSRFNATKLN